MALGLVAACAPAMASGCEDLRDGIEAKIRANGVTAPRVWLVDAADAAQRVQGVQVVGNCDQGARLVLYSSTGGMIRETAADAAPAAAPTAPQAQAPAKSKPARPIIVECAEGGVVREGPCKR